MNSKTFIVIASLAASAFAQLASIVSPTNGSTITAGSQLIGAATDDVQIAAIVLGLEPCLSTPCTDIVPGQLNGNFSMVVPENVLTGPSILSLTHLQMVGANKNAALATTGIIVTVA
ncbi:hypothetical protein LXA43DRAFT_1096373 [Ganoderma leucocontextum]|nr:hypothetical protein LXA43DRAFT_1096373 [Ganoderma leucocontextum]